MIGINKRDHSPKPFLFLIGLQIKKPIIFFHCVKNAFKTDPMAEGIGLCRPEPVVL